MVPRLGRDDRGLEKSQGPPRAGRTGAVPQGGSSVVLLPGGAARSARAHHPSPLSNVGPDLIQEVNVQSPVAVTLSDFSFSFLEHQALSSHCHATIPVPFLPPVPPCPDHFSWNSLSPLPSLCPAGLSAPMGGVLGRAVQRVRLAEGLPSKWAFLLGRWFCSL